jgi:Right handed beta helix region
VLDIGFPDDAYTNVISANGGDGVRLDAARRTSFNDNRIGTDRTGTRSLGNGGSGIALLDDTQGTVVGGGNYFAPNVISANDIGVRVADSSRNVIGANLIGTDVTGTQPLGNRHAGIQVSGNRNVIGTFDPFAGVTYASATIAFNGGAGISVEGGAGNFISENFIFGNAALGIDLAPAGVNPNDPEDTDAGPNDLQNYPVLRNALSRRGTTTVTGRLTSRPNTSYTISLFDNVACDPSNFGEGQRPLTTIQVTTNQAGVALFSTDVFGIPGGDLITSTATNPDESTSEFSNCLVVRSGPG